MPLVRSTVRAPSGTKTFTSGLLLAAVLLLGAHARAAPARTALVTSIAVIEFKALDMPDQPAIGQKVAELLIPPLQRTGAFAVRETTLLRTVFDEWHLNCSEYREEDSCTSKAGKLAGTDAVVTGTVFRWGHKLRVQLRLLDIASGRVLWSDKAEAPFEHVDQLEEPLAESAGRLAAHQRGVEPGPTDQVAALLAKCEAHFKGDRLTIPAGANAVACWQEVLALERGNAAALAGLDRVVQHYAVLVEREIERLGKAKVYLQRAMTVSPEHPRLATLRERLIDLIDQRVRLRASPRRLSDDDVDAMLRKRSFFDSRWNKGGSFRNDFVDNGDSTITDRATGLMWQKGGSKGMNHADVKAYVRRLSERGFAGCSRWRLPTLEEGASLLEPEQRNDRYIDPRFEANQRWIWTADECEQSSSAVWGVDFLNGSVDRYAPVSTRPATAPRPVPGSGTTTPHHVFLRRVGSTPPAHNAEKLLIVLRRVPLKSLSFATAKDPLGCDQRISASRWGPGYVFLRR